jgi:K+-transporting ATPase KdpF subunit
MTMAGILGIVAGILLIGYLLSSILRPEKS